MTTSFPDWVEPMAATLTRERFTDEDWVFERKLDAKRPRAHAARPSLWDTRSTRSSFWARDFSGRRLE